MGLWNFLLQKRKITWEHAVSFASEVLEPLTFTLTAWRLRVRPEAEPDHFLDDDLVLTATSDALVELFAVLRRRLVGRHESKRVADGYLRLRLGLDRSARVAAGTTGCLRFSRKPPRKLLVVPADTQY